MMWLHTVMTTMRPCTRSHCQPRLRAHLQVMTGPRQPPAQVLFCNSSSTLTWTRKSYHPIPLCQICTMHLPRPPKRNRTIPTRLYLRSSNRRNHHQYNRVSQKTIPSPNLDLPLHDQKGPVGQDATRTIQRSLDHRCSRNTDHGAHIVLYLMNHPQTVVRHRRRDSVETGMNPTRVGICMFSNSDDRKISSRTKAIQGMVTIPTRSELRTSRTSVPTTTISTRGTNTLRRFNNSSSSSKITDRIGLTRGTTTIKTSPETRMSLVAIIATPIHLLCLVTDSTMLVKKSNYKTTTRMTITIAHGVRTPTTRNERDTVLNTIIHMVITEILSRMTSIPNKMLIPQSKEAATMLRSMTTTQNKGVTAISSKTSTSPMVSKTIQHSPSRHNVVHTGPRWCRWRCLI